VEKLAQFTWPKLGGRDPGVSGSAIAGPSPRHSDRRKGTASGNDPACLERLLGPPAYRQKMFCANGFCQPHVSLEFAVAARYHALALILSILAKVTT
jgi:hypothetical protein